MLRFALSRALSLALSLAVASLVIFFVIEVAPGDPASFMLGVNAQPDTLAALRAELGLDVPKWQRYVDWVTGMMVGDFMMLQLMQVRPWPQDTRLVVWQLQISMMTAMSTC